METDNASWRTKQKGAAMVEFALTLPIFLFVVFAIMEACFVVMDYSRANEVTRELARIAIVHDPVCDIFTPGSGCALVCPSTAAVTVPLPADCGGATDTTGCMMMTSAAQFIPDISADNIELIYACSDAGAPNRPDLLPLVTVSLRDLEHDFMLPDFLGIETSISIPGFAVTRIGEDMYTEK